jgi:Glycosyl transferase family 2
VSASLTVLVAARDEESRITTSVTALRDAFPDAEIVVADDGSRDATAERAEFAGARVVRLERRGKGQALTLGERACASGPLLLCDADLGGDLRPLLGPEDDLVIASFARRSGSGFGIAKRIARTAVRVLGGVDVREPLSGQRALSGRARAVLFPVAAGFGAETRMTIDAGRAGLTVSEVELDLEHRSTGRDAAGVFHRARQLHDLLLACCPQALNHRSLRLPLMGLAVGAADPRVLPVAVVGALDDRYGGAERGFRQHLRSGSTTGVLKLAVIPAWALLRTRSPTGAVLVALAANALNQLDTGPGRALKAFGLAAAALGGLPRRTLALAVLLASYDLREMAMLGDAGSNALGAVIGLRSVERFTGARRIGAICALTALTAYGEHRSLGAAIESTPVLRMLDGIGRRR